MPRFWCQSAWSKKRDQPLRFISASSMCLLSTRPLRENCLLIWLFCWENDLACRNTDSRLFSAVNDTKFTSCFVSSGCFCFHLKKIPIFFCGIPLVGFLIPFAFVQMGSLISFLTFNLLRLQTGGLCWHPNIWEASFVYLCVRISVRYAFNDKNDDIGGI